MDIHDTVKIGSVDKAIWEAYLPPIQSKYDSEDELAILLDILARVVEILDIPDASFVSYSTAINNMSSENLTLGRSLTRLKHVEEELKDHLASLRHESKLISHWNNVLIPGASDSLNPENASTIERRKDALVKKAKEYHRELEVLLADEPSQIPVTLGQLIAQKEKNQAKERELKGKRAKIKAFQGLPPNLELARHELRVALEKQSQLIQLRERLLGRMADGVA